MYAKKILQVAICAAISFGLSFFIVSLLKVPLTTIWQLVPMIFIPGLLICDSISKIIFEGKNQSNIYMLMFSIMLEVSSSIFAVGLTRRLNATFIVGILLLSSASCFLFYKLSAKKN